MVRWVSLLAALLAGVSCTPLMQAEQPALIRQPSKAGHNELETRVAELLGREKVTLAPDVFTRSSLLVLERPAVKRLQGTYRDERSPESVERFRLLADGPDCLLYHIESGRHVVLTETGCVFE